MLDYLSWNIDENNNIRKRTTLRRNWKLWRRNLEISFVLIDGHIIMVLYSLSFIWICKRCGPFWPWVSNEFFSVLYVYVANKLTRNLDFRKFWFDFWKKCSSDWIVTCRCIDTAFNLWSFNTHYCTINSRQNIYNLTIFNIKIN